MPVSGVLLICRKERLPALQREIAARPRAEVRAAVDGNLVVVTDTETLEHDRDEVQALEALDGVVSAYVVFSNVEDLAAAHPCLEVTE